MRLQRLSGLALENSTLREILGIAQYVADVARPKALQSPPSGYAKYRVIETLRKRTGALEFIESGTYRGDTASRCARHFRTVLTVELDPELAQSAAQRLNGKANVEVLQGDASELLPSLLERPSVTDAIVFLDGHFSGGVTAHGSLAEPAIPELQVLSRYPEKICAAIVDDFRCFGTEPDFPSKSELLHSAEQTLGSFGFSLTVQMDQLLLVRPARP